MGPRNKLDGCLTAFASKSGMVGGRLSSANKYLSTSSRVLCYKYEYLLNTVYHEYECQYHVNEMSSITH